MVVVVVVGATVVVVVSGTVVVVDVVVVVSGTVVVVDVVVVVSGTVVVVDVVVVVSPTVVVVDVVVVSPTVVVVDVVVGFGSPVEVRPAAKLRSLDPGVSWWTSTAMVLVPMATAVGGIANWRRVLSAAPDRPVAARVDQVMGPVGMLSRATSIPFT